MKRIVALMASFAMLVPGAAVASANSTSSSYGQHDVQSVIATRSPATTVAATTNSSSNNTSAAGSLPFTGLDIGALALGGVVLLGAGVAVRRMSATSKP
jgi:hypothetical protein